MKKTLSLFPAALMMTIAVFSIAAPAGATTQAQLKSKLLSVTDLPSGWSVDNSASGGVSGATGCLAKAEKLSQNAQKGVTRVEVKYTQGQFPDMDETLVTGKAAAKHYAEIVKWMNGCKQVSISGDGVTFTGSIGQMSFPKVGDATNAWAIKLTAKGYNVGFDYVLFKAGSIAGNLVYADLGTPDPDQVHTFVQAAVDKIEGKPVSTTKTF